MKKIGFLVILLSAISSAASPIRAEAAGGCSSSYTINITYDPYCEEKGCGFLWLIPETQYQDSLWERECKNSNGNIVYEAEIRTEKLGCC